MMPRPIWTGFVQDVDGRPVGTEYGGLNLEDPNPSMMDEDKSLQADDIAQGFRMVGTLRTGNLLYRDVMMNIRRIFEASTGSETPQADVLVQYIISSHIPDQPFTVGRPEGYDVLIRDVTEKRRGHRLSVKEIKLIDRLLRIAEYRRNKPDSMESECDKKGGAD